MNAEKENNMEVDALIDANMHLYEKSTEAIKKAAKFFGVTESINFHIFSAAKNSKIPKDNLKGALKAGGAKDVVSDKRIHLFLTSSNDGEREAEIFTNLYVASI